MDSIIEKMSLIGLDLSCIFPFPIPLRNTTVTVPIRFYPKFSIFNRCKCINSLQTFLSWFVDVRKCLVYFALYLTLSS